MGGNEVLTAPAPIDGIDMQADVTPMVEAAGYTYQRVDGTIERAMSAEDAFARCPVLGKLAVEAPEQASILLELAAAGREKMQQKQEEQQEPKPEEKAEVEPKKQSAELEPELQVKVKTAKQNSTPEQTIEPDQPAGVQQSEQVRRQPQIEIAKTEAIKVETPAASEQSSSVTERIDAYQWYTRPETAAKSQTKGISVEGPKTAKADSAEQAGAFAVKYLYEAKTELSAVDQPEITNVTVQATEGKISAAVKSLSELGSPIIEPLDSDVATDYQAQHANIGNENEATSRVVTYEAATDVDGQLEQLYEPETIETYHELLAITTNNEVEQAAEEELAEAEEDVDLADVALNADVEVGAAGIDIKDVYDFEAYMAERPKGDEPVTLQVIQERAESKQPLGQTLIQLVKVLSGPEKLPGKNELYMILKDIEVALPACYISQEERLELQITPEMTGKILILLRQLGYERPREVLVGFASQHGLTFLLQALQYMCQLNDEDNRKEFLSASVAIAADDDEDVRLRIGKVLSGLISKLSFELAA